MFLYEYFQSMYSPHLLDLNHHLLLRKHLDFNLLSSATPGFSYIFFQISKAWETFLFCKLSMKINVPVSC